MLDWRRDARGLGDAGVTALLARVQAALGGAPLTGTQFLFDGRQMLAAARQIEGSVQGRPTTLFVGFQRGEQAAAERRRYERLAAGGVTVVGFGVGEPEPPVPGMRWVDLALDRGELINQWFLVTAAPEPIVFAGFEVSPPERFGHGGPHAADRSWAGFVSDDPRLAEALISHLEAVGGLRRGHDLPGLYLVATHDGTDPAYERVRRAGLDIARRDGARVLLYDRSTESYLVDPYQEGWTGTDADWPSSASLLGPSELSLLGMGHLAEQVRDARRLGVEAAALPARGVGVAGIAEACARFGASRAFLPAELARPGLVDRVRHNTLAALAERLGAVEIFLVGDDGIARTAATRGARGAS